MLPFFIGPCWVFFHRNPHTRNAPLKKINLQKKLSAFDDHWHPRVIGEVNDMAVKLAKVKGTFVWHHHETEDELFLVIKGRLLMRFRDREIWLNEGETLIVPRGIEHQPVAEEETHLLLFEPKSTLNTGNVRNERTIDEPKSI